MSRLNQLHANDYPSQTKINADFSQLYSYLVACERGNYSLPELLAKIFDTGGSISDTFIDLRWSSNQIQFRLGGGAWENLGVGLAELQGPAGPSGAGTGDMTRAVYDPNNDSKIGYNEMLFADNEIPTIKVNGLDAALLLRAKAEVSAAAPGTPSYPPAGPVSLWLDTSNPAAPVWKYWDGAASWRNLVDVAAATGIEVVTASLIAGESIASRDLVTYFPVDYVKDNTFASGGAVVVSGGVGANAFDGNTGTQCDTASTTGHVGYDRGAGNTKRIGQVRALFNAAVKNHTITIEYSLDAAAWVVAASFANANYDGTNWSTFNIVDPPLARAWRLKCSGGADTLIVREIVFMELIAKKKRVYKAGNAIRGSIVGVALENGTLDNRFKVQVAPGLISGLSGLTAGETVHSTTVAGSFAVAASGQSYPVGEARSTSDLNFMPQLDNCPVGGSIKFSGPDANIPPNYLKCDGSFYSRVQFQETLYSKIGTTVSVGDGVTTFGVPNDAGFIIRAW